MTYGSVAYGSIAVAQFLVPLAPLTQVMKNAPFVQSRFKSGMLAMFSPLVSAITEVGKEIVKPEQVAVTAAAAPIVLALIGKGIAKLCDHAADKFNESSLKHLCFASLADLFQDLHNEAESRPADDCEMLAMWHELTDHAAKDKTWVALTFVGRDADRVDLRAWRDSPIPFPFGASLEKVVLARLASLRR